MANAEHVQVVKQGAKVINAWRRNNKGIILDLTKADLTGADLTEADLRRADMSKSILTRAELRRAKLGRAKLRGARLARADLTGAALPRANLTAAHLSGADFRGADLTGATLTGAWLIGTDLFGASLGGADLTNSSCQWAEFGNLDLSGVIGLETVRHKGPSSVGVDTLYRSRGQVPAAFLRGCGVPDILIDYLPSLLPDKAYEFYSCFISHSSKDEAFARKLHERMRQKRLRVWYAPEDIRGGKKLHEQIDQAIRVFDKLLLVLSKDSMASEWVKTEVHKARQRELREGRRMLFPVSLVSFEAVRSWESFDADTGKDLAREVREYFIPDFSAWRDEAAFEKAFARLLRDLRAEEKAADTDNK